MMQLIVRLILRIAALVLKFALTIVVARTLGFAAVGDYGLALAVSVLSSKLLGFGFSAEINRRLSLPHPYTAIRDAQRLLALYICVYLLVALIVTGIYVARVGDLYRMAPGILASVLLVAFSEHLGLEANTYIFSLHRPRCGAILLFLRTGGWAGIAIAGMIAGFTRSMELVFSIWWLTNVLTVIGACWFVSCRKSELEMVVHQASGQTRDFDLVSVWMGGFPFFIATVTLSALQYAERFFASGVVSPESFGRYVFSWSIANSIQTISYATIVATAGPRLVRSISQGDVIFRALLGRSARLTICTTIAVSAAILLAHRPIFRMARELASLQDLAMLFALLASFVLRSIADLYWSGAVALRLGKQVAISISLVAIFSLPIEWLLVSRFDAMGAALAHLTASVGIVALLMMIIRRHVDVTEEIRNQVTHAT